MTGLCTQPKFRRGFVEQVSIEPLQFLEHAQTLYELEPVRHLNLRSADELTELLQAECLIPIISLSFAGLLIGDAGAELIAASPRLAGLEWIDLSDNNIGRKGVEALAASTGLDNLRTLEFQGNCVSPHPEGYYDWDGTNFGGRPTKFGKRLEEKYGRKRWLAPRHREYGNTRFDAPYWVE